MKLRWLEYRCVLQRRGFVGMQCCRACAIAFRAVPRGCRIRAHGKRAGRLTERVRAMGRRASPGRHRAGAVRDRAPPIGCRAATCRDRGRAMACRTVATVCRGWGVGLSRALDQESHRGKRMPGRGDLASCRCFLFLTRTSTDRWDAPSGRRAGGCTFRACAMIPGKRPTLDAWHES